MKILCSRKTLTFLRSGDQGAVLESLTIHAKPTMQDAPDWVRTSQTFIHASKDGDVIELGAAKPASHVMPPTVDEVVAQRHCTPEEAVAIVEIEKAKYENGEYPYPKRTAPAGSVVDMLMKAGGLSKEAAEAAINADAAARTGAVANLEPAKPAADAGDDSGTGKKANGKGNGKGNGKNKADAAQTGTAPETGTAEPADTADVNDQK